MRFSLQSYPVLLRIMRLSACQVLIALAFTGLTIARDAKGQELLNRRVTIQMTDQPVRLVLNRLSKLTQVRFTYSSAVIRADRRVSLSVNDQPLSLVLDDLLRPLQIDYRIEDREIILNRATTVNPLIPKQLAPDPTTEAYAERRVSGRVVTAEGNEGLPGVNITLKGTTRGTTADGSGNYSFNVPEEGGTLVFSFIGYLTREEVIGNRSVINLSMTVDPKSLNEVVVVGYGTQKLSDVTGTVSSAELKRVNELPLSSVDQVLTGRVAGVQITQSSGQAGAGTSIRIRGGNSINGINEPLFVVDGFPIINDNGAYAGGGPIGLTNAGSGNPGQGNPGGALNWLNPADIETVDILRDASATAIYGSRGANGVVIITTKKGKTGQARLTLNTNWGVSSFNTSNIKLMNASQFAQYDNLRRAGLKQVTFYKDTTVNGKLYPSPNKLTQTTDWLEAVTRQGITKNYSLGFTGGKEVLYSGSISLFNQQTPLKASEFQRANFRLSLQTDLARWLHLENGFSYTTARTDNSPSDVRDIQKFGLFEAALAANPAEPVYNSDGNLNFIGGDPSNAARPGINYSPVAYATDILNRNTIGTFLNNLSLRANVIKGLMFEVRGSVFNNSLLRDIYYNSKTTFNGSQVGGLAGKNTNQATSYLVESFATYDKSLGINNLNAVLGYSYQVSDYRTVMAGASGFPNDILLNEDLGSGSTRYPVQTNRNRDLLASYFVRVNNIIKDKYILTFTARYDGSSKFGAGNKYAFFPSGAISWRLSEEPFMKEVTTLSDLKLRASYGLTGNQAIASGQSQSFLYTTSYPIGGVLQTGVFPGNIGNPGLKWETTAQTNVGIDFGILQQRFTGSFNYYVKNTRDLLQSRSLPVNSGFYSILTNIGSLRNKGFELELRGAVINKSAFRWDLNLNVSRNVQTLTSLGEGVTNIINTFAVVGGSPAYSSLIVGQPVGVFYGYRRDGLYTSEEQLKALPGPNGSAVGSPRFRDLNGDKQINEQDREIIGDPNPDFTYGIINNFTYKRFDLNVLTQGVVGGQIYNLGNYILQRIGNQLVDANDYYTASNTTARYPAPGNNAGLDNHSDFSIESATYLRVKSATLGYNLPMGKIKFLSGVRVYASATNLLTLTGYKGFDPEVNSFGQSNLFRNIDILTVPQFKTYTAGLTITL